jgi:hypothetical protein
MSAAPKALSFLGLMAYFGPVLALVSPSTGAWAQTQSATVADDASTKTAPPRPTLRPPKIRGLSWSIKTGRIPSSGGIIHGSMGFSELPRLAYHHTIQPNLSVGGLVAFDYGHNHPSDSFDGALLLGVPVRYRKPLGRLDLGLAGVVGVRFPGQRGRDLSILIEAEANLGFPVHHRFIVGGGVSTPLWIGAGNKGLVFDVPLLLGPFIEFHVTPPLALTLEAKAGPYFTSEANRQTGFGMRTSLGIAYRL